MQKIIVVGELWPILQKNMHNWSAKLELLQLAQTYHGEKFWHHSYNECKQSDIVSYYPWPGNAKCTRNAKKWDNGSTPRQMTP